MPIVAPILLAETSANVTAVWLGVMIGVNMQTSFLTPPFESPKSVILIYPSASTRTFSGFKLKNNLEIEFI